jgi:hypothetical protein
VLGGVFGITDPDLGDLWPQVEAAGRDHPV